MTKYDSSYLKEVTRTRTLETLSEMPGKIDKIRKMLENKSTSTYKEKKAVLEMDDFLNEIYDQMFTNELKRQKKAGKEFLTNDDIDRICKEAGM